MEQRTQQQEREGPYVQYQPAEIHATDYMCHMRSTIYVETTHEKIYGGEWR